ncbi:restriction endonuclease subunit S [Sideroxydans sp. CL21]|uniref:restriction endonuclease subunit S n=1 Tax=Sideroxydans sp. CL21 TaxID=2600596 RepID=UPI0024BBEE14|nr:restriction endonuclease subunit S [Sideroxydans sp. CL21]
MSSVSYVQLGQVAKLNPTLNSVASISAEELVDFLPMSGVEAGCSIATPNEVRQFSDVRQGYTYFSSGDVLLAKITPCFENGKIAQALLKRKYGFGSTEFHVIRADPERLNGRYLVHFLRRDKIRLDGERKMTGSAGQRRVPKHFLESLSIPLLPLPEQIRIAAILDHADALRAKRREVLAQLDSLAQAIFIDMFGDPVRGNGLYPLSNIEEIAAPEKYSIVDGPFGSSMKPDDYREFGIPVIRIANITKGGEFSKKNLLYIDKSLFEKLKRSSIKPFDVLVSRVGTIGNTCIFPEGIGDALLSTTGVCKIMPDSKQMLPEFLHQAIQQPAFQEQINKSASTSVQKYFNLSALKRWKIVKPPLEDQRAFTQKFSQIQILKLAHQQSLAELDNLFASLQHRAFRGEL